MPGPLARGKMPETVWVFICLHSCPAEHYGERGVNHLYSCGGFNRLCSKPLLRLMTNNCSVGYASVAGDNTLQRRRYENTCKGKKILIFYPSSFFRVGIFWCLAFVLLLSIVVSLTCTVIVASADLCSTAVVVSRDQQLQRGSGVMCW